MSNYCAPVDAFVERGDGFARLYNCDRDMLYAFPDDFTDEQIFEALRFANDAFATGFEDGKAGKILELRRALKIKE